MGRGTCRAVLANVHTEGGDAGVASNLQAVGSTSGRGSNASRAVFEVAGLRRSALHARYSARGIHVGRGRTRGVGSVCGVYAGSAGADVGGAGAQTSRRFF